MRLRALWRGLAVGALLASSARADGRTQFLIDRLKAEDFRVRTNAALQLGATGDAAAVQPLCGALDDSNEAVRSAAAVALGRLGKPDGASCVKQRLASEKDASVKLQLTRALETLGGSGGGADDGPPKLVPTAQFYVAVSSIANSTGRTQAEIDKVVAGAIKSKLAAMPAYQLAPKQESTDAARAVITKRKFKNGFFLSVSVDAFDYSGGNLRVRVKVAISSYPGKDLRGEVPVGLTQTGVRSGDHGAEDNLMAMAAAKAVEQFAQYFQ